jgi:predicted TIM-barrel fold metal-dependent hydrolase
MRDGFRILDVDRHVMEPITMWPEYLPSHMREYAPRLVPFAPPGDTLSARLSRLTEHALLPVPRVLAVGDEPLMRGVSEVSCIEVALVAARRRTILAAAERPKGHLAEMDATGVDVALMLPTFTPLLVNNDAAPAAHSRAYAQAYNRWLSEFCAFAPDRLLGAAVVSRHDPESMVPDLELALRAGFHAVVIRPNPIGGRTLGDPALERFWEACENNDVTVLIHEGTHTRAPTVGADRFSSHFAQHACSHPVEGMMALLALLDGGVLEARQKLRVGFLESGCGWLPYWLWRLDHVEYAQHRAEVRGRICKPPSEYFREQCWIALEPSEALLPEMVAGIGEDRLVFGTDFPHPDHEVGIVTELFTRRSSLGDQAMRSILWDNPCRLAGITRGAQCLVRAAATVEGGALGP